MKKIDLHTHTSGVSFCSEISPQVIVLLCKLKEIDTIVLTNHYSKGYMQHYGKNPNEQTARFIGEYRTARDEGKKVSVNVLLGAEVNTVSRRNTYDEFLLYGADENFFLSGPCLYELDQKGLYKYCQENNVLMYQAHPYRSEGGCAPGDPEYMDGIEFNVHPSYIRQYDKTVKFADKYNLALICGNDFHHKIQAGAGGIYIPKEVKTNAALAEFLKKTKRPKMFYK